MNFPYTDHLENQVAVDQTFKRRAPLDFPSVDEVLVGIFDRLLTVMRVSPYAVGHSAYHREGRVEVDIGQGKPAGYLNQSALDR